MKRILCYGDSNTWGHNPEALDNNFRYGDTVRWTGVLQRLLGDRAAIAEEGLCGRTIMYDDPTAPYRNGRSYLPCILQSQEPLDLVIFMLGTNDTRHIYTPCVKEIAIGMAGLVKTARNRDSYQTGIVPEVLVVGPAHIRREIARSDFYGMYDEESVGKSRQLYQAYETVLQDMEGVWLFDAEGIAEVSVRDCIHLTEKGHYNLGEALAKQAEQILSI